MTAELERLESARAAVAAGFYTDELGPDEEPFEVELDELLPRTAYEIWGF